MGDRSTIGWLDTVQPDGKVTRGASWNPVIGCSMGCDFCYAARMATRLAKNPTTPQYAGIAEGGRWTGKINLVESALTLPLRWTRPRRIFVDSMGDLGDPSIPIPWLSKVLSVIGYCSRHTFIVLTKRPDVLSDRMSLIRHSVGLGVRSLCNEHNDAARGELALHNIAEGDYWPFPNLIVGISATNQRDLDSRWPHLQRTPATRRVISIEPMLGPIDTSVLLPPIAPIPVDEAPASWDEFTWPEWVPEKVKAEIEKFWSPSMGRGPKSWLQDCIEQNSPPFGARLRQEAPKGGLRENCQGRWVHCWNNIGRLIDDEGVSHFAAIPRTGLFDSTVHHWHDLHGVFLGGQTGPGAAPLHPDWVRTVRDQCTEAGIPFFFKSWGEWIPAEADGWWDKSVKPISPIDFPEGGKAERHDFGEKLRAYRIGKAAAGRILDGRTWDEFPEVKA